MICNALASERANARSLVYFMLASSFEVSITCDSRWHNIIDHVRLCCIIIKSPILGLRFEVRCSAWSIIPHRIDSIFRDDVYKQTWALYYLSIDLSFLEFHFAPPFLKIFLEFASPLLFLIFRNIEIEIIIGTFYRDKIFDKAYKAMVGSFILFIVSRTINRSFPLSPSFICPLCSSSSYLKISIPSSNLDTRTFFNSLKNWIKNTQRIWSE